MVIKRRLLDKTIYENKNPDQISINTNDRLIEDVMKCYAFYVVVLLVHHISGLQVGAHLRIPLTRALVCPKRRLKGTVGVTRGK